MFERILVPLDGSPRSEAVLRDVSPLLRRTDAELLLVCATPALPPMPTVQYRKLLDDSRDYAERHVNEWATKLADRGIRAIGMVKEGPPSDVIVRAAAEKRADLIAMSSHGRTGIARWALGSVTERVLRTADVPVLVVRSFGRKDGPEADVPEPSYRRLLLPTDGSKESLSVVPSAVEFARLFGAEILTLHVREPYPFLWAAPGGVGVIPRPSEPGPDVAEALANHIRMEGVAASGLTVDGDPASEILDRVSTLSADAIVLSTRGRSGLPRWLLGSVAEKVVRASPVPVLVLRTPAAAD